MGCAVFDIIAPVKSADCSFLTGTYQPKTAEDLSEESSEYIHEYLNARNDELYLVISRPPNTPAEEKAAEKAVKMNEKKADLDPYLLVTYNTISQKVSANELY